MSRLSVVPPPLSESHRSPILGYQACLQTFSPQCLLTRLSSSTVSRLDDEPTAALA